MIFILLIKECAGKGVTFFEQKKCVKEYSNVPVFIINKSSDEVEFLIKLNIPSNYILVNPEIKYNLNGISLIVDTASTDGMISGCSCGKEFHFYINLKKYRNFKKAYLIVDRTVYKEISLGKN